MTNTIATALFLALTLGASTACSDRPAATSVAATQTPTAAGPQGGGQTVTGTVVEVMDAASYTYLRVETATGEVWVAASRFKAAVGDRVVVPLEMPMENFHSKTLERDFPLIYFASWITREGEPAPPTLAAMAPMPGHPPATAAQSTGGAAPVTEVIQPAEGGLTVAGVWSRRASLAGTKVTVRGKVVKFNGGILGRNWLHVQDGTGSATDGTNDLTVTSATAVRVGDIITVTGTIAIDKDFGAGYKYVVILEDAAVVAK